jgi:hypothetical protein
MVCDLIRQAEPSHVAFLAERAASFDLPQGVVSAIAERS